MASREKREKRYDLFDIVFDICGDTLSSRVLPNVEDKLTTIVWKEIKHKSVVHADSLKQLRQLVVSAQLYIMCTAVYHHHHTECTAVYHHHHTTTLTLLTHAVHVPSDRSVLFPH